MEFPLFTLSTKPDMAPREYTKGNKWVKLSPSAHGLATVHDRDVLIYAISQCMAAIKQGQKITSKKLRFHAVDLLTVTNRKTSGEGYKLLQAAFRRLQGTQIETNITTGGEETWKIFSFIDDAQIVRKTRDGRMQEIEVTLSDWIFNAINENGGDILTLHRHYFRLRKPLERRLYEIARKHCGTRNKKWRFSFKELHDRTGSTSTPREFKRMLLAILENSSHIPDYTFSRDGENVLITPKADFQEAYSIQKKPSAIDKITISDMTHAQVKKLAKGWDTRHIEDQWRSMLDGKRTVPDNPEGSFTNYVKWFVKENGASPRFQ